MAETFGERDIVSAESNPKTHRPLFHQSKGKVWKAVKRTAKRTLVVNPKKLLPDTKGLEHLPPANVYTVASTIFGAFGTGFSGAGVMLGVDAVANLVKVNTAAPWYAPVRDITRLVGEGILGMKIYPYLGKELTGDSSVGKALWLGGTILTGIDLGVTAFKYVALAANMVASKAPVAPPPAAPAAQESGLALVGLSGLGGLMQGVHTATTKFENGPAHAAETNVAGIGGMGGLDGGDEENFLLGELEKEKERYHELTGLLQGVGAGTGGLIGGIGKVESPRGGTGRLTR